MSKIPAKKTKEKKRAVENLYPEAFLLLHNINNYCMRYGVTDEELCEAMGKSDDTLYRRRRHPWTFTTLEVIGIARELHVSIDRLYADPVVQSQKKRVRLSCKRHISSGV